MATSTTLISSQTLGSAQANITLSSIPSTYTDLVLKISARTARASIIDYGALRFNSDSGSNYSGIYFYGFGTGTPTSSTNGNATQLEIPNAFDGDSATANTFANVEIYIPNYAGSNQKSVSFDAVTENNATNAVTMLQAGKWSGTSAINSITIYSANGFNLLQYSTAYLYGIKNS